MNPSLLLTLLMVLVERLLDQSPLKNASLSVPVVLFLLRISESPGISRAQIERELGLGAASGSQSLKWLLAAGHVEWEFAPDQRTKKLFLTATGKALLEGLKDVKSPDARPEDVFKVPSSLKRRELKTA